MKKLIFPAFVMLSLFACKDKTDVKPDPTDDALVITKADFESGYKPNSTEFKYFLAQSSSVNIPSAGANQTWDFSQLTEQSTINFGGSNFVAANNPAFPSATYSSLGSSRWTISSASSQIFPTNSFYELSNAGYFYLGFSQNQPAEINIPTLGANISFPVQNINYTGITKSPFITFPAKLGNAPVVSNGIVSTNDYLVNAPAFGLNNTPGSTKLTINETIEIIGSGTANLKGIGNKRVLLVKQSFNERTNYFLNGAPAPAALLDQLGATDGTVVSGVTYRFFGEGMGIVGSIFVNANGNITSAVFRKQ